MKAGRALDQIRRLNRVRSWKLTTFRASADPSYFRLARRQASLQQRASALAGLHQAYEPTLKLPATLAPGSMAARDLGPAGDPRAGVRRGVEYDIRALAAAREINVEGPWIWLGPADDLGRQLR